MLHPPLAEQPCAPALHRYIVPIVIVNVVLVVLVLGLLWALRR